VDAVRGARKSFERKPLSLSEVGSKRKASTSPIVGRKGARQETYDDYQDADDDEDDEEEDSEDSCGANFLPFRYRYPLTSESDIALPLARARGWRRRDFVVLR
jgi:hypothetical protein